GTFKAGKGANPYVGNIGERHYEKEVKVEVIFPAYLEGKIVAAMRAVHPYEEVAYDVVGLSNKHSKVGSGIMGELAQPMKENEFLEHLKKIFSLNIIRHTKLNNMLIKKVAICGGAGSFLISNALGAGADVYVTADVKYHEFFDANGKMLLADIGHYESEQFTIELIQEILEQKFPTFAVL